MTPLVTNKPMDRAEYDALSKRMSTDALCHALWWLIQDGGKVLSNAEMFRRYAEGYHRAAAQQDATR